VFYVPLDVGDDPSGVCLIPAPIKRLSGRPELNNEVSREVLRFDLTPFLPPQPYQGGLIIPHDDPGVRTAEK
jgi:hypothetical protein